MNQGTKIIFSLLLAAALAVFTSPAGAQEKTLKLGHVFPNEHGTGVAALKFAELVAKGTNNRIKIQVFPSSQLGNERDMLEGVQMGSIDMAYTSGTVLAGFVEKIKVCDLPFIFRDYGHMNRVITGPAGKLLLGEVEKGGKMKGLGIGMTGWRHVMNNKKPVHTPADMAGMKIRVLENPIYVDAYKALGATPVTIPWGEVPMALKTGVVDGADLPTGIITQQKMYVVKYVSLTGIQSVASFYTMNLKTFQSLSAADQKVLLEAAAEAAKLNREIIYQQDEDALKELPKHNIAINKVDQNLFRKITDTVYKKYEEKLGRELIQALVNTK